MERIKKQKALPLVYFASLQLIILAFLTISAFAHKASFFDPIKLFLYQFFAWFLVGFVIISILNIQTKTLIEVVALSYALGGIASLATYFLIVPILGIRFVLYGVMLESFFSILYIVWKRQTILIHQIEIDRMVICLLILIVYYSLATLVVSFVNVLPSENGGTGYYVDWPFWVGNNIAFTKGFPNQNFRLVGTPFKYHYFSSILTAETTLTTGVDVVEVSFFYSYIFGGLLLVFSAFFLMRFIKNRWCAALAVLCVLVSDGRFVTLCWHTLICPFGFDYGYAYGMLALASLIEIVKQQRWREYFGLSALFLAMTTGCKGPIGIIILVGFGVAALWLLIKKQYLRGLYSGIVWLGSFVVVYLLFIHSPLVTSAESKLVIGLINPVTQRIYNNMLVPRIPFLEGSIILKIGACILLVGTNVVISVLIVLAFIQVVRDIINRQTDPILIILFAISVAGAAGMLFTRQIGGSEMYFVMASYPSAALAGVHVIENEKNRVFHWIQLAVIIPAFLYSSLNWCFAKRVLLLAEDGITRTVEKMNSLDIDYNKNLFYRYYADEIDYEAYCWLRDHTPTDSIIAVDSFEDFNGQDNSMLAGIFSERYIWNEVKYAEPAEESGRRNEIVNQLPTNPLRALELMSTEAVHYLLHQTSKGQKDDVLDDIELVTELYRNEHYVIYRIGEDLT